MDENFPNRMKWSRSYLREGIRGQDSELKSFKFAAISSYLIIDDCHPSNLFIFSIFPVMYSTVIYCTDGRARTYTLPSKEHFLFCYDSNSGPFYTSTNITILDEFC